MNTLERISSRIQDVKVFNVPIGDAILLLAGLGINDALVPAISKFIPIPNLSAVIGGSAIGAISKLPAVERILGPTMSNVISATAVATGLDYQIGIRDKVRNLVSSITGGKTTTVSTGGISAIESSPAVSLGQADISEQERRILATMR